LFLASLTLTHVSRYYSLLLLLLHFKPIQTVGGGDMIDGWEEAIKTMRIGERAIVRITDPELGYGATGFVPIVPPNAEIELDLEILDAKARSSIDFDTLAIGDPDTPVRSKRELGMKYHPKIGLRGFWPCHDWLETCIKTKQLLCLILPHSEQPNPLLQPTIP